MYVSEEFVKALRTRGLCGDHAALHSAAMVSVQVVNAGGEVHEEGKGGEEDWDGVQVCSSSSEDIEVYPPGLSL